MEENVKKKNMYMCVYIYIYIYIYVYESLCCTPEIVNQRYFNKKFFKKNIYMYN